MSTSTQQHDKDSGWNQLTANKLQKRCRSSHRKRYWTVHDRDTYTCPKCGRDRDEVRQWDVHHIDHDVLNGRMMNLVALCQQCHYRIHGRQPPRTLSGWKNDFLSMGEEQP